jgi:hypothetical protein
MEAYKTETREILNRFIARRISYRKCLAALDTALSGVLPNLGPEHLPAAQTAVLANSETLMNEMKRRHAPRKAN